MRAPAREDLDKIRAALEARLAHEKLTPMMRQYLSVKRDYPHALVLFRMGDFFEVFFDDAKECARLLDLTLTARSKERDIPMAGVPHHAIDGYLARLIELGRTVVMVDQVEDPKQAKGLVRREVTRILSPGTYLDPSASGRLPTYLGAVAFGPVDGRKKKRASRTWGLAVLELSTGEFKATGGKEDDTLLDEIGRLGIRELLVLEMSRGDARVERIGQEIPGLTFSFVDERVHDAGSVQATLSRIIGEDEARGVATALAPDAIYAAGLTLRYAEESQLRPEAIDLKGEASLKHVQRLRPYVPGDALVLDAQARDHLELFVSQGERGRRGTLIEALDEARTAMGARLLASWLAYPLQDVAAIRERQDAVEALAHAPSALDGLREALSAVSDLERLLGRVVMGRANPRDLAALRDTLAAAPAALSAARAGAHGLHHDAEQPLGAALDAPKSALLSRIADCDPCADVVERLQFALLDDPVVDLAKGEAFRPGFDAELDRLGDIAKNGKGHIEALEAREREATGISNLKIRYNKVFGFYIEVTRVNLSLVPASYVRKQTTVNSERYFTPELKELEDEVLHAEQKRLTRAVALFADLVTEIGGHVVRLRGTAEALAQADVLACFAWLAERRGWVRPEVDEGTTIEIADGRHPVIEQLSESLGERFVPNDIEITDEQRLLIITGPNMAGKSTIMRQTALVVILAQMGSFVPASRARIGIVDRIFTRVGASDDLSRGRSTFMVEMNETARILRSATARSLIVLDEIGRGTSTFDGLSIAWAVAEHLHDEVGAKTLFATHYHELTEICRDKPNAANRHVAVKEWNDEIVFLRKLMPGATNRSYGVQVARLAGLPTKVVQRAREVLDGLEAQALSAGNTSAVEHLVRARALIHENPDRGQMFLFSAPAKPEAEPEASAPGPEQAVLETLDAISIDDLTPRQALEQLARLQDKLRKRKGRASRPKR